MLKREFQKKDVTRIRNIAKGKAGNKTMDLVGYEVKKQFHKEGDIWEEDNKMWIIINGERESYIKSKKLKDEVRLPLFCPECEGIMDNIHDSNYYKIHNKCFNCVITMESRLKEAGKWDEYEKKIHNDEIDSQIKEFRLYLEEKLNEQNDSYMSEQGDLEKWVGDLDIEKVETYMQEVIEYLTKQKK